MQFKANAKINLGLFIKSKRPDGYHELESVFVPIPWYDLIHYEESDDLEFTSSGIEIPNDQKGNLVLQAYQLLAQDFDLPNIRIHLEKNVPIGAGLGGGSSDASFMLKSLNENYSLGISLEQLENYALQLGSDCPFFIRNEACIAKGRGELLDYSIDLELKVKVKMVVPPLHISTAKAYSLITPKDGRSDLIDLLSMDPMDWQGKLINDFEEVLCSEYTLLSKLRDQLKSSGAFYCSMSGSGSAFYAFYHSECPSLDLPKNYVQEDFDLII